MFRVRKNFAYLTLIMAFFCQAAFSQGVEKTLTPEQMRQDLAVLKEGFVKLHPGLYRYNTPESLEKSFKEFQTKLDKPLSEREFFILVSQFASRIKCGHTYLNPLNQPKAVRNEFFENKTYIPFYFQIIDRRMLVTKNAASQNLPLGSEIKKINGVLVGKIIDALLTVTKGDGKNSLATRLNSLELNQFEAPKYSLFDIYFPLFFPLENGAFKIEAVDFLSKREINFVASAMTKQERTAKMEKRYGKTPTYDDGWFFEIQPDDTAYLKISNSITWRLEKVDYKKFLADAFSELRAKAIKNLIIDWRENGGGDDELGEILSGYLAKTKVGCFDHQVRFLRFIKFDENLMKYVDTYDDDNINNLKKGLSPEMYEKSADGLYKFLLAPPCKPVEPLANNFTGQAYVISDASNASAAFQFVRSVRDNRLGTLVGQESGGNRQGINGGDYIFLRLPNSHFEIDIPLFYSAPPVAEKDTPIIPDVVVKRKPEDVANKFDRELTVVKSLINGNEKKSPS